MCLQRFFAERLIEKMPGMSRVYYSNSGSEANEKAYKIVRQIAHNKYGGKKHKILYRNRDYHGTTITALSSCGQEQRKDQYGPFTPGFVEVPHCLEYRSQWGEVDDYGIKAADAIEEVILREGPETVGGLILEPVTAGGGVIVPPKGYWERVQEICRKHDVLLIIDEVVCGMGRTGTWFGYQHYGVEPDIVTMAKGVASGYAAISCTVTTEAVFNEFKSDPQDPMSYFRDISTFGGCASGPAAALENMRILEDEKTPRELHRDGRVRPREARGIEVPACHDRRCARQGPVLRRRACCGPRDETAGRRKHRPGHRGGLHEPFGGRHRRHQSFLGRTEQHALPEPGADLHEVRCR